MNLVVGASGTAGSRVVRRLLERGARVRAVSRDPARLAPLERAGSEVVRGDLLDDHWMDDALVGVRRVVLAAQGVVPPSRRNNPERCDEAGTRRMIDAAKRAGVERVVYVSAALAGPASPVLFGRLKHRVEQQLAGSGLSHAIVRPTTFIETHALRLMGEPLRDQGRAIFLGDGTGRTNWVSAEDVADFVVGALLEPASPADFAVIGGPDTLSRLEVLAILEDAMGRRAKRIHVPLAVLRVARAVLAPLHPGARYLLDFVVADAAGRVPPELSAPPLDWTGPTTLESIVRRWAAEPVAAAPS